jgi:hypothetical protein
MGANRSLGSQFGWLWAAYTVSTVGTWLALDAFPLIAILVLHAGTAEVSLLSAMGLALGAVIAVLLGPWVEFRRKRPVMVTMDLIRFAALMSVPLAFALGSLGFTPWQYDLAFAAPGVGGLIGLRLARRLVARFGQHQVIRATGALRAVWSIGLAFIGPGAPRTFACHCGRVWLNYMLRRIQPGARGLPA